MWTSTSAYAHLDVGGCWWIAFSGENCQDRIGAMHVSKGFGFTTVASDTTTLRLLELPQGKAAQRTEDTRPGSRVFEDRLGCLRAHGLEHKNFENP